MKSYETFKKGRIRICIIKFRDLQQWLTIASLRPKHISINILSKKALKADHIWKFC